MDVLTSRAIRMLTATLMLWSFVSVCVAAETLVLVNSTRITDADLVLEIISRHKDPKDVSASVRKKVLEDLVDRELVFQYLTGKKVRANDLQVTAQIQLLKKTIEDTNQNPDKVLKDLGFNAIQLRKRLQYASMWQTYFDQLVTDEQLQKYFETHKEQFDGTEVRASQIYLKLPIDPQPEDIQQAEVKLAGIKKDIEAGKITFAEAARKWSESPSGSKGGDLGFTYYRGKTPLELTKPMFALEVGQIGEPFQSRFGMHLLVVTEKRPGLFQFAEVRGIVLSQLKKELWISLVHNLREKANIEYAAGP